MRHNEQVTLTLGADVLRAVRRISESQGRRRVSRVVNEALRENEKVKAEMVAPDHAPEVKPT